MLVFFVCATLQEIVAAAEIVPNFAALSRSMSDDEDDQHDGDGGHHETQIHVSDADNPVCAVLIVFTVPVAHGVNLDVALLPFRLKAGRWPCAEDLL